MSRFWADAGWIAAIVWAAAWFAAHCNALFYKAAWKSALDGWNKSAEARLREEVGRRRDSQERAP